MNDTLWKIQKNFDIKESKCVIIPIQNWPTSTSRKAITYKDFCAVCVIMYRCLVQSCSSMLTTQRSVNYTFKFDHFLYSNIINLYKRKIDWVNNVRYRVIGCDIRIAISYQLPREFQFDLVWLPYGLVHIDQYLSTMNWHHDSTSMTMRARHYSQLCNEEPCCQPCLED